MSLAEGIVLIVGVVTKLAFYKTTKTHNQKAAKPWQLTWPAVGFKYMAVVVKLDHCDGLVVPCRNSLWGSAVWQAATRQPSAPRRPIFTPVAQLCTLCFKSTT